MDVTLQRHFIQPDDGGISQLCGLRTEGGSFYETMCMGALWFLTVPERVAKHRIRRPIVLWFFTFDTEVGYPRVTSSGGKGKDGEDLEGQTNM